MHALQNREAIPQSSIHITAIALASPVWAGALVDSGCATSIGVRDGLQSSGPAHDRGCHADPPSIWNPNRHRHMPYYFSYLPSMDLYQFVWTCFVSE